MKNINNDIKNNTFKPVYLLCGTEDYLKKQMKDNLKAAITGDDEMNLLTVNEKVNLHEIVSVGYTVPFFSEKRLIILDRTDIFKTASVTFTDEDGKKKDFSDFINNMPEYLHIIIVDDAPDKRTKLYKAISKNGYVCELNKQTGASLKKYITAKCIEHGKAIDPEATDSIISRSGSDLGIISGELEKLFAYTMDKNIIDTDDVENVCSICIEDRIFDMIRALGAKDKKKAYSLYFDLLALKEPAIKILILMQRAFCGILQVKEAGDDFDRNALAKNIGMKGIAPFAVANYKAQADNFTIQELKAIIGAFARTEEDIKTGRIDDRTGTELMIAMALK